jgi:hypothetical protein
MSRDPHCESDVRCYIAHTGQVNPVYQSVVAAEMMSRFVAYPP